MDNLNNIITLITAQFGAEHTISSVLISLVSSLTLLASLVLGTRYLWRKLKPLKPPVIPALCGCEPPSNAADLPVPGFWQRCALAINYLRTRREWRYAKPWVMVLGEQGAGKTSLLASIAPSEQQALHGRDAELAITGTQWHDLNEGFFIDPNGHLPYNAATPPGTAEHSNALKQWDQVLNQLDGLRPERALDGILLVISAASLQHDSREQRQATAENIRQQLQRIEQHFEFALPVYVVVTALDSVPGFAAFWRAQPISRRAEMVGWSAPTQNNDSPPAAWAEAAFKQVAQQLKPLQLEAAAQGDRVAAFDADQFFLFPRHFQQLREPVQQCLASIFQASPWQTTFFCRGIYFTGAIAAKGNAPVAQEMPREDVSFISDLMLKKILQEPGLGRPTRAGVWSRNGLIRRVQVALVAGFSVLILALVLTYMRIDTQVHRVIDALQRMQQMQASVQSDNGCILQAPVYQLLEQIASIDAQARSWIMPLSLVDNRLSTQSAQRIAADAFKNIILPGVACQIEQRAALLNSQSNSMASSDVTYPQALDALLNYVQQVNELETNVTRFKNLLATPASADEHDRLPEFVKLTEYAYGAPLADKLTGQDGLLAASLSRLNGSDYSAGLALPSDFQRNLSLYIAAQAKQVNLLLLAELQQGAQLLSLLEQKQTPILRNIKSFSAWLNWVRDSWLGSSAGQNPLLQIQTDLAAKLQPLVAEHGYPALILNAASAQFDAVKQYPQAMNSLNNMQLSTYGNLFSRQNQLLELNPKLLSELAGLQALSVLGYMAVDPLLPFTCQGKVSSWNIEYLNQTASYYKQYQDLLSNPLLKDGTPASLYQQLANYQLELVLNYSLQQAQATGLPAANRNVSNSASALEAAEELQQNQQSLNFAKRLAPIQALQDIFTAQAFNNSAAILDTCVSQFSNANLKQIMLLTEQSMLYQVTQTADASDIAADNSETVFFDLGSTPTVKDYLAQQVSRVQVLVGYATPFLEFLARSPAASDDSANYWNNTSIELQRYTQGKDPKAQVSLLDSLFLQQLAILSESNCNSILNAYQAPEYDYDLFSNYRQQLEDYATSLCSGKRNAQASNLYQQLAARFNRDLAGHYPFGELPTSDAKLATVKAFFNDYEASREALVQSLTGLSGSSWTVRRKFLTQLDNVAAFLHNSLAQASAANAMVKLGVTFRALAGEGSEQVANWRFSSASNSIAYPNQGTNLDWPFAQPLALDLTWANNSYWRPAFSPQNSDSQIEGLTASFGASGNWALLRLIANHPAHSGAQLDSFSANTELLEFNVNLIGTEQAGKAKTSNATLYLSLQLSSIDAKTMTAVSLKLPATFPYAAPQ